uniref:Uncharacterized protein n=1 Tax=Oryza meridionalis TaxID=40149 RepID=A0A0E0CKI1_9ORYZ
MAAASSSGDADAGDRLKGSATSGVTGLRAAADEVATAAATRRRAGVAANDPRPISAPPSPFSTCLGKPAGGARRERRRSGGQQWATGDAAAATTWE